MHKFFFFFCYQKAYVHYHRPLDWRSTYNDLHVSRVQSDLYLANRDTYCIHVQLSINESVLHYIRIISAYETLEGSTVNVATVTTRRSLSSAVVLSSLVRSKKISVFPKMFNNVTTNPVGTIRLPVFARWHLRTFRHFLANHLCFALISVSTPLAWPMTAAYCSGNQHGVYHHVFVDEQS